MYNCVIISQKNNKKEAASNKQNMFTNNPFDVDDHIQQPPN